MQLVQPSAMTRLLSMVSAILNKVETYLTYLLSFGGEGGGGGVGRRNADLTILSK